GQGLTFHLETEVLGAAVKDGKVTVEAKAKGKKERFQGDKVLAAVGRKPYTAGLGLEQAGGALDPNSGRARVAAGFQTSVPGVYVIGDLIAGPMLAHKASEEGIALAERLAGHKTHVNYHTIPSVIYTAPELASVGLTEEQVKETGKAYRTGKFPFS